MAVVLIEGYDHMSAGQISSKGWTSTATSVQPGRIDGQCARRNTSGTIISKSLPSTYATLIMGFAYRAAGFGSGILGAMRAGATSTLGVFLDATNHLQIKNSGATVIATGPTALSPNIWYYVEVKLFVNGASGTCELQLNGISEIASTVGNFGSSNIDNVGFAAPGGNTDIDDIYVCDTTGSAPGNTFLGDTHVETLFPNTDGTYGQFTPTPSGSHFSNIDEVIPDSDVTYNSDANAGDIDTYMTPGIIPSASVPGIQVNLFARKDDASARQIAPLIRQAATNYPGTSVGLSLNYLFYSQIYALDPTGSAWTANNVNADEYGVKVIA